MLQNTAILKQELIEIAQQGFSCLLSTLNYMFLMIPFYRRTLKQMGLVEEEIHHCMCRFHWIIYSDAVKLYTRKCSLGSCG